MKFLLIFSCLLLLAFASGNVWIKEGQQEVSSPLSETAKLTQEKDGSSVKVATSQVNKKNFISKNKKERKRNQKGKANTKLGKKNEKQRKGRNGKKQIKKTKKRVKNGNKNKKTKKGGKGTKTKKGVKNGNKNKKEKKGKKIKKKVKNGNKNINKKAKKGKKIKKKAKNANKNKTAKKGQKIKKKVKNGNKNKKAKKGKKIKKKVKNGNKNKKAKKGKKGNKIKKKVKNGNKNKKAKKGKKKVKNGKKNMNKLKRNNKKNKLRKKSKKQKKRKRNQNKRNKKKKGKRGRKHKINGKIFRNSTSTSTNSTCNTTAPVSSTCLQNALDALNFDQNQISNFFKQKTRMTSHQNITASKLGKKGEFSDIAKYMLEALGGNISTATCGSNSTVVITISVNTTSRSRSKADSVALYNQLLNCSSSIFEACVISNKTLNATEEATIQSCANIFNLSRTASTDCRTNTAYTTNGTAACECWSKAAIGITIAKANNCGAADKTAEITAQKNKCKKAFSLCKKAEDKAAELIKTCSQGSVSSSRRYYH